jgi:peptidoglycan/LPS O-acetylase OafA/YrhL
VSVTIDQEEPATLPRPRPAPAGPPARPVTQRIPVLDLLRFFAALGVLSYHYIGSDHGQWGVPARALFGAPMTRVAGLGWMAVECFFVISGFVICLSSWGRTLSEFFTSRVTRLLPVYLFAVIVTAAQLYIWPDSNGGPQPSHVLYNLTMLHGFLNVPHVDSVYWTLYIELKFYLLWAIVVRIGLSYRRVVAACALWLIASIYSLDANFGPLQAVVEPRFSFYFIAGITLYLMHRFGPTLLLWGLLAVSVILAVFQFQQRVTDWSGAAAFPYALAVLGAFFLVMMAVSLRWLDRVRWRGFVVLGALTYPLYLLHQEIGHVAITRLHGAVAPWLLLTAVTAGALGIAYLAHRLVERPAATVLKRQLRASFARIRQADTTRSGRTGLDTTGLNTTGLDTTGLDTTERDTAGLDTTGADTTAAVTARADAAG